MTLPTANSFRLSHEALLGSIVQVQSTARNYLQAKPALFELNERMKAFFGREDEEFYNQLKNFFAEDREVLKMIEFLIHDLNDLKIQFLIFSEKHAGDLANQSGRNFVKDFRDFSSAVIARVKMEEDRLIPLLARINETERGNRELH